MTLSDIYVTHGCFDESHEAKNFIRTYGSTWVDIGMGFYKMKLSESIHFQAISKNNFQIYIEYIDITKQAIIDGKLISGKEALGRFLETYVKQSTEDILKVIKEGYLIKIYREDNCISDGLHRASVLLSRNDFEGNIDNLVEFF